MNDKLTEIRKLIVEFKDINDEEIQLESDMSGELALDSADRVELALSVEDKYDISISPEEHSECETIKDLIDLINLKITKKMEV
ncbi:phosphopantetheine-binding protein [Alkalihalobacillus sp. FSL R5-0424]